VTATIAAATLGEECAPAKGTADCAPSENGGFAPGGCGGCQRSSVQMAFDVTSGKGTAKVEIVSVTLHDASTGKQLDALKAGSPQQWMGNAYVPWDESLAADLKASYELSAPAWSTFATTDGRLAYQTPYRLHVTLSIDGVQVVLESVDLTREPPVVT
jgi:hypothetical protein